LPISDRDSGRLLRVLGNILGAAGATFFARASLEYFLHSHRLIGAGFFVQQSWVAVAFLARRSAQAASHRWMDWVVAFGGTFGGVLLRPNGLHSALGVRVGLELQLVALAVWAVSFWALGRSFGFVAANRGVVTRGPYALVRHPIYASFLLSLLGYLLQSTSMWNLAVLAFVGVCTVGRTIAEERLLDATSPSYRSYRTRVRWRLVPGLW
jgi:protein-S-isoprenylcysteine O-methyltransferase Ste14